MSHVRDGSRPSNGIIAERSVESVAACNLCGGTRLVELSRRRPLRLCGAAARPVFAAGSASLSPRLTAAEYADFYATAYRPLVSAYHGRRIDAETVQEEQRVYAAELVEFLRALAAVPTRARVLDVGGSTGRRRRRRPGRIRRRTRPCSIPAPGRARPCGRGRDGDDRRASRRTPISATGPSTSSSSARRSITCSTSRATLRSIRAGSHRMAASSSTCSTSSS